MPGTGWKRRNPDFRRSSKILPFLRESSEKMFHALLMKQIPEPVRNRFQKRMTNLPPVGRDFSDFSMNLLSVLIFYKKPSPHVERTFFIMKGG
jgi:hypothetical protein